MPLVSVIMSSYNHENYVEEALKSIFLQTYNNFELIIRDDGSEDDTVQIINDTIIRLNLKKNIKVEFVAGENIGLIKSLNWLLSKSRGEIIVACASDDVLENNKIEEVVRIFTKYQDFDLLACNATIIDSNDKIIKESFYLYDDINGYNNKYAVKLEKHLYCFKNLNYKSMLSYAFGGFGLSFRKRLLKPYYYRIPESISFEDYFLSFLGLINKGVLISLKELSKYRRHGLNFSSFNADGVDDILKKEIRLANWLNSVEIEKINYINSNMPINENYTKYFRKMKNILAQNIVRNKIIIHLHKPLKRVFFSIYLFLISILGAKRIINLKIILFAVSKKRLINYLVKVNTSRKKILL